MALNEKVKYGSWNFSYSQMELYFMFVSHALLTLASLISFDRLLFKVTQAQRIIKTAKTRKQARNRKEEVGYK